MMLFNLAEKSFYNKKNILEFIFKKAYSNMDLALRRAGEYFGC